MNLPLPSDLSAIHEAAARVERRLRLGRGLAALVPALLAALGAMAAAVAAHRALPALIPARLVAGVLVAAPVIALAVAARAAARRLPPRTGAVALDRHHGLRGRLAAALAFATQAPPRRTPLMELAIDDAGAHASHLSPESAAPLAPPRGLLLAGALSLATVGAARLQVERDVPLPDPAAPAALLDGVTLSADDLAYFRDAAARIRRSTPGGAADSARFTQLVNDLAAGRLDRAALLRRIRSLDRALSLRATPGASALRPYLADLRDIVHQAGDPAQAARVAAFRRRAAGAGGPGTPGRGGGDAGEGDDGGLDGPSSGEAPLLPPDPPRHDPPRPAACHGGSNPTDAPGRAGRSADPEPSAEGAGEGHDPRVAGAPKELEGSFTDLVAPGRDTGEGKSRRSVILAAATRGFGGAGYHDAFVGYETVAEEHLDRDRIPDGHRFYVRRYFELIRPRE